MATVGFLKLHMFLEYLPTNKAGMTSERQLLGQHACFTKGKVAKNGDHLVQRKHSSIVEASRYIRLLKLFRDLTFLLFPFLFLYFSNRKAKNIICIFFVYN